MADLICELLTQIYVTDTAFVRLEATKRGITVEQLAAAAIVGALRQKGYVTDR